ncbi:MAG: 3-hydroxyacyl-CoA dehydrogenase family protein [Lachnospirales bacterium]
MTIKKVSVIGAGLMGNAIAIVFAKNPDIQVCLFDVVDKPDFKAPIKEVLDVMIDGNILTNDESHKILGKISYEKDLEKAVENADFVIECVPEILDLKQNVFAEIEGYVKESTILATNTSVMSVTEIFSKCKIRNRVIGAHFWNPGHLIPLVEVVKTVDTDDKVIDVAMELLKKSGKKPILCKKDVPGFIANRLQHALWREAFYMVDEGIADPKTIDEACNYGPGLRWPVIGPMENSDLVGLDLSLNIHNYILKHLADNHEPSKVLKEMYESGKNGFKTGSGWQDYTEEEMKSIKDNLQKYLIKYNAENKF